MASAISCRTPDWKRSRPTFVADCVASLREQTATLCEEMLQSISDGKTEGVHQKTLNRLIRFIDQFRQMNSRWRADEPPLRVPSASQEGEAITAGAAVSWAEEHLFDRSSVVREHELWRYALEFARGSALTPTDLKRETASCAYIREANGKLARKDALEREWRIVQMAKHGTGRFAPLVPHAPQRASKK